MEGVDYRAVRIESFCGEFEYPCMYAAADEGDCEGNVITSDRHKLAIRQQITFAAEDKLYIILIGCFLCFGEGMHHAVIGDGNCLMPPFCGKLDDFGYAAGRIHCGHTGMQMQLHPFFLGIIHALFIFNTVYVVGKDAIILSIRIIAVSAANHERRALLLNLFNKAYRPFLHKVIGEELYRGCIGLIGNKNGDYDVSALRLKYLFLYDRTLDGDRAGFVVELIHRHELRFSDLLTVDDVKRIHFGGSFFLCFCRFYYRRAP